MIRVPKTLAILAGVCSASVAAAAASAGQTSPVPAPAPAPPVVAEAPREIRSAASLLAETPRTTLTSGSLRVMVALPDAKRGFYRSTRFDWSGMITSVTLGRTGFYGMWIDGVADNVHDVVDTDQGVIASPRNAATGPAEEFANRDGETVPGYNAAHAGETFLKIGVGHLRKDDDKPYDHFRHYTIVDGGRWTVRRAGSRIVFGQRLAADASGYGYDYEKTVTLSPGGVMTIAHRLRNTGLKPIKTQIYTHNFARFDGAEIGPGVGVHFPEPISGEISNPSLATVVGNDVRYGAPLMAGDRVQLPPQPGTPDLPQGALRVTGANGATITMQADVPLVRTVLWSIRRTVAVEPFVAIDVAPGAEQLWSWRYTFTAAR